MSLPLTRPLIQMYVSGEELAFPGLVTETSEHAKVPGISRPLNHAPPFVSQAFTNVSQIFTSSSVKSACSSPSSVWQVTAASLGGRSVPTDLRIATFNRLLLFAGASG